ncbi:hypothetical protein [Brunnivagina elsteri]|uniref:hypothetical protein n=1 Tax=Brunnivagina elsteri TaxID=1247191 RepID=UPI0014750974|nr:hypothetical protein [Calothrix elsteri]
MNYCHQVASDNNRSPEYFVPEFVKCMLEINTPPCESGLDLAREYLQNLQIAITAANSMNLRLYISM